MAELTISADAIQGAIEEYVGSFTSDTSREEVGTVVDAGDGIAHVEGLPQGDWVLVDAYDVIVHIFRPEVRAYYDLEGMWSVDEKRPEETVGSAAV